MKLETRAVDWLSEFIGEVEGDGEGYLDSLILTYMMAGLTS